MPEVHRLPQSYQGHGRPTCSGKTAILKTVSNALPLAFNVRMRTSLVNTSTHEMNELYGHIEAFKNAIAKAAETRAQQWRKRHTRRQQAPQEISNKAHKKEHVNIVPPPPSSCQPYYIHPQTLL